MEKNIKNPVIIKDSSLNKYKDVVLFPDKVAEANRILKEVGLPKQLFKEAK
jgi:hypothetical protein